VSPLASLAIAAATAAYFAVSRTTVPMLVAAEAMPPGDGPP